MYRLGMTIAAMALALFSGTESAQAKQSQPIDDNRGICESAARHMEQVEGIPAHLLVAISLAETGRWDDDEQVSFAWPWTVTALGKGRYYPSRTTAIAAVRQFQAKGVSNIDVGCMQVNLRHHPDAFADLEQAFDPTINIAYASGFLLNNHAETKSWTQAAAAYHSKTPKFNRRYKAKIMKLWKRAQQQDRAVQMAEATPAEELAYAEPVPMKPIQNVALPALPQDRMADTVDHTRTSMLNKTLRARAAGEKALQQAGRRMTQLDAWRSKQFADNGQHMAIMQRAEKMAQRRLERAGVRPRSERFSERRQNQMAAWRAGLPPSPNVSIIPDS